MTGDLSLPFDIAAQLQNEVTLDATIDKGGYSADEASVAAGKAAIAAAITDKGVSASKNDSFSQLSGKIESIVTGESGSGEILKSKIITGFNGIYSNISFFPNSIITAESFDPPKLPALFDQYYDALPAEVKSASMSESSHTVADWYNYSKDKCPFILFINGETSATFICKYNREVSTTLNWDCVSYTDITDPTKINININPYVSSWFLMRTNYRWSSACFNDFNPKNAFDTSSSSTMGFPYIDGTVWRFTKNDNTQVDIEILGGNLYDSPSGGYKINNTYGYAYRNNYGTPKRKTYNSAYDWVKVSDIYSSHSEGILLAFGNWYNTSSDNNGFMITKAYG